MVFNAALGNTDDHLKNFALLHGEGGWRLSPAYDLLPDVLERREHVLHFGTAGTIPTRAALDDLACSFGVTPVGARRIRQQVLAAVAAWRGQMRTVSVPEIDIERLEGSISRRLSRLGA
jgi:serine/threonine-protein kinase HipA